LVDLETRRPIELREGREAAPLQHWLEQHPGVEVVVRDRAGAYADAARLAAPTAQQHPRAGPRDRFHLPHNASVALDDVLKSRWRSLDLVADGAPAAEGMPEPLSARPPSATEAARRAAHIARWEEVRRRRAEGQSIARIAREMRMERRTVRGHLATPEPPRNRRPGDRGAPQPRPQGLASPTLQPFVSYLQDR